MKIGIDCRTILNPGFGENAGIGHYTYYLVSKLLGIDKENQYVLFFDSLLSKDVAEKMIGGRKNVEIRFFPFHQYKRYLPFVFSHILISIALEKEKLDIFHSPIASMPLSYKGKSVVTVHDLAIYKHPEWFPSHLLVGQKFSTKTLVPKSLKKAKKIIAVSKSTKRDIQRIFKIRGEKIKVIYEGVEFRDLPEKEDEVCGVEDKICFDGLKSKYGLKDNYIFFLGTIEPRKNVEGIIKAYSSLINEDKELREKYQLVLAGAKGWKHKDVFKAIENCSSQFEGEKTIKYLGYIPAEDKHALLKNSSCFVFPSFYEGFGLPVLEALSLGAPTVASKLSSIPEIAKEAAVLIDPNNTEKLKEGIRKILTNKKFRDALRRAGIERARDFSWEKCAEETLEVYKSV
jgi:glycosyltransferase involved in cell wall biosynthesis